MRTSSMHPRARGFTLVEALVALLALSIGLLGIAGLQLTGMRYNMSAAWRSQATYLGYDIIDRMRANRNKRSEYIVNLGAVPAGSSVAAMDLTAWKANLASTLPLGDGTVLVNGSDVTVTVQWSDTRDPNLNQATVVFTMRTRI